MIISLVGHISFRNQYAYIGCVLIKGVRGRGGLRSALPKKDIGNYIKGELRVGTYPADVFGSQVSITIAQ